MRARYFEINERGYNIRCKIYENSDRRAERAVLFGHGFGGHKDNKAAERFAEYVISKYKGIAVITFNLPCHGDDVRKKLTLADCLEYLEIAANYAKEKVGGEIYSYATSFSGYLTLKYIMDNGNPFKKIALRCPVIKMYEAITERIMTPEDLEEIRKGKSVLAGFDRKVKITESFLEELKEADITNGDFLTWADDILIIYGTDDEIIASGQAAEFAENNLIDTEEVEGADHRFRNPLHMDKAIKLIVNFFGF